MKHGIDTPSGAWTKVITADRGWLEIDWRELWSYRDLVFLFLRRDFVAVYKQTILGPFWFLLQPLSTTLVFTIVFGRIAQLSTNGLPPFLFYLSGIVAWNYFSDCLIKTSNTFTANAPIFGKVYFPRLVMPIATVLSNLLTFSLQLLLLSIVYAYMRLQGAPLELHWHVLLLPLIVLQLACLGLGVGCLVSALTTRYRDLAIALTFGVQLWMYGSCIFFPLSSVSEAWRWLIVLNPVVPAVESFRLVVLGSAHLEAWHVVLGIVQSGAILTLGIVTFNRVEKSFTDTI